VSAGVVTLGAPLVPDVQREFGASEEASQWSYTITLLVGATITPLLGRLADGHRRRRAVLATCGLVAVGCAVSAVAGGMAVFLVGRALQGLAVALVAMAIATARDLVPGAAGTRLVALLSVTTALGAGAFFPLTTVVADHLGLRAAYAGAALLAVLVTVGVLAGLPSGVPAGRPSTLDVPGAAILVTGAACGLLAVSEGNDWGWASAPVLGLFLTSALLLAWWVRVELRTTAPLVDLRLLGRRDVLGAHLTGLLMGVSLYNTPVLVTRIGLAPESTGYGAGLTLTAIGLVMLPIAFGNYLGSWAATRVARIHGRRLPLAGGGLVAALGPLALLVGGGSVPVLVAAIALSAVGAGATFGTMPGLIVDAVEARETGSATSVNILLRAVGGAIGSAATGALVGAAPLVAGFPARSGIDQGLLACVGACLVSVVVAARVPERRVRPARTSPTARV
jgi:MFS family permease